MSLPGGLPGFALRFDLTTTMSAGTQRRLAALPLFQRWRRALMPHTCFIGATCTEYAPLPLAAETLAADLVRDVAPRFDMLIIKDLPLDAVLTGDAAQQSTRQLIAACQRAGFFMVEGQALAYVPIDFATTDDFLARLSRARRKDLKRKLKTGEQLAFDTLRTGDAFFFDPANLDWLYALYTNVFAQSDIHFDRLTPAFFRALFQDASLNGVVFLYRAQGAIIGYNLCFEHEGRLLDKYVGFAYPAARDYNLYTVSWFRNLDYARRHGLHTYVAGWTDPEIKRALGARFTFTQHAVYVRNPALRALLKPLRRLFEADRQWREEHA